MRLVEQVHHRLAEIIRPGDTVVDATVGNGHDTFALAELVGETGRVLAFDVQAEAIASAQRRVPHHWVSWIHAGHETLADHLPADAQLGAIVFNTGYLPGGDHNIVTRPETTIVALEAACDRLRPGGIASLILYRGHAGGMEESEAVERWLTERSGDTDSKFELIFHEGGNALQTAPRWYSLNKQDH